MKQTHTEKEATDLRARAKDQAEALTKSALVLAETLFAIHYSTVFVGSAEMSLVQAWKFESFHEYAEVELGIHGSTAMKYVSVHDSLILGEGMIRDELPNSITKLIQLTRIARSKGRSVKSWLKRAKEYTCCELENAINEELGERGTFKTKAFYMTSSQVNTLNRYLRQAKDVLGTSTNGETLAKIVKQWSDLQQTTKLRRVV